jgi:hypothetical protein
MFILSKHGSYHAAFPGERKRQSESGVGYRENELQRGKGISIPSV